MTRVRVVLVIGAVFAAFLFLGCGSADVDTLLSYSSEESLAIGKELMAQEKYKQAEQHFSHAFEAAPNSVSGREALQLAADALYFDGGISNLIKAESKYRDFQNRFPTSDRLPYVQLQIGNCLAGRVEKPDRDQSVTLDAVRAYEELLRIFPDSDEALEARVKLDELAGRLGEHEYRVARFYFRYGLPSATISRLEYLLEHYPTYEPKDEVYLYLGLSHHRRGNEEEARTWFTRLNEEYPDSDVRGKIPSEALTAAPAEASVPVVMTEEPIDSDGSSRLPR